MNNVKEIEPIIVDIKGLQTILRIGRNRARDIGRDANAEIRLSKRCLRYDVEKVKTYIRSLQEEKTKKKET